MRTLSLILVLLLCTMSFAAWEDENEKQDLSLFAKSESITPSLIDSTATFEFDTISAGTYENLDKWAIFSADSGSTTANSGDDDLAIIGSGGIVTSISGDILTIDGSGVGSSELWSDIGGGYIQTTYRTEISNVIPTINMTQSGAGTCGGLINFEGLTFFDAICAHNADMHISYSSTHTNNPQFWIDDGIGDVKDFGINNGNIRIGGYLQLGSIPSTENGSIWYNGSDDIVARIGGINVSLSQHADEPSLYDYSHTFTTIMPDSQPSGTSVANTYAPSPEPQQRVYAYSYMWANDPGTSNYLRITFVSTAEYIDGAWYHNSEPNSLGWGNSPPDEKFRGRLNIVTLPGYWMFTNMIDKKGNEPYEVTLTTQVWWK